jgi:hypothetical protein
MFEEETLGDGARCAVGSIPEGLGGVGFFPWGGERFFSAISSRCMLLLYLKTNTHDLKKKKKKKKKWLAGDSRLRQTFSLRIYLVERQSSCPLYQSDLQLLSLLPDRSLEASLSTSASRTTAGPIEYSLDRCKPVTQRIGTAKCVKCWLSGWR